MASQDKGRPLPKFGEWDVNNPASAEGFTVIFSKARDAKKSNGANTETGSDATQKNDNNSSKPVENYQHPPPVKKWFCCF
ncbi:RPM1-interacting protein 4 [Fagus crenata]